MSETHPGPRLSAYVDGELSPAEAAEVEAHLWACTACRTEVEEIRRLAQFAREAHPSTIDDVTATRFLSEHRTRRRTAAAPRGVDWKMFAAAAAFLLVVSGAFLLRNAERPLASPETLGQGQAALSATIY